MKRARFTKGKIIGVLREHEAGANAGDLARKHGVSEGTLYNWKAKFGGMDVSEARRLRQLEDEKWYKAERASLTVCAGMDFSMLSRRGFDQNPPYESPFCASCLRVAPDRRRIDHIPPVIGEAQLDQGSQERISHSLFGPTPEANVN